MGRTEKGVIINGDALRVLKELPNESVDCCVTSPPYWALRDYGVEGQLGIELTFQEYITKLCNIFDEVKRVLKKSGTCWVNLGDTYISKGESRHAGYADPNNGHHGFIYQATNFLYTGVSTPKHQYIMSDGSKFDIRRGLDKKGNIKSKVNLLPTHRYLYFCGNKKQVSEMKKDLKMSIYDYPKGDNKKYDTSYTPTVQKILF